MKYLIRISILAFLLLSPKVAQAQTTYTIYLAWDAVAPNTIDPTQDITSYTLTLNGVSVTLPTSSVCTTTCRWQFNATKGVATSVSVAQSNIWSTSTPVTINFTPNAPGNSRNVKITLNP